MSSPAEAAVHPYGLQFQYDTHVQYSELERQEAFLQIFYTVCPQTTDTSAYMAQRSHTFRICIISN